jgi:hypothetical protein
MVAGSPTTSARHIANFSGSGTVQVFRNARLSWVATYENVYVQSSYVCEQVHYVREPQLHDALRPRAPPSRDDAQPDDDDERRRDDERRLSDDAPAPGASVIAPSERSSFFFYFCD